MKTIHKISTAILLLLVAIVLTGCGKSRDEMLDGRWKTNIDMSSDGLDLKFVVELDFDSKTHEGTMDMQYFIGGVNLTSCHVPLKWELSDDGNVLRMKVSEEDVKFSFSPEFTKLAAGTGVSQADLDNEMRSQMKAAVGRWGEEKIESIEEDKLTLSESGYTMVYYRVK